MPPMETRSRRKKRTATTIATIPEAILVEILARLPLRIITRFKSVSKTWKSMIESNYFRRLFISLHKNSSSSWSLLFLEYRRFITEPISFHECKTWNLPKSLGSYILSFQHYPNLPSSKYFYKGSSNGLVLIEVYIGYTNGMTHDFKIFVGNPISQQWVEVPPPPVRCYATGLLTRLEDGLVSSFKVVMTGDKDKDKDVWNVYLYSSETGIWSFKRLLCERPVRHRVFSYYPPEHLIGKYYLWERDSSPNDPGMLLAHDFYDSEDADGNCRVISFPVKKCGNRCLTTSRGDVIFIQLLSGILKVWLLNDNNSESSELWQLSWEINIAFDCFPMGMNPFDADIVYLWSRQHCCLVSSNLKTQKFVVHGKLKDRTSNGGCYLYNTRDSKGYMEGMFKPSSVLNDTSRIFMLSQFVLPKWMDSVPRLSN